MADCGGFLVGIIIWKTERVLKSRWAMTGLWTFRTLAWLNIRYYPGPLVRNRQHSAFWSIWQSERSLLVSCNVRLVKTVFYLFYPHLRTTSAVEN